MDTSSRFTNYDAPPSHRDPSGRVISHGQELFPPYILTGNMDAGMISGVDWKDKKYMCGLGRPLWSSVAMDPCILAEYKLTMIDEYEKESVLAVFLARVGLDLSHVNVFTSELVANHMATLLGADAGRTGSLVSYVSEPVLSEGARRFWRNEKYVSGTMLPEVRQALVYGQVLEGQLGETCAITTLLMAMDTARGKDKGWATMRDFFDALCAETLPLDAEITSADIGVNHFIQWHKDIKKEDLETLTKRRAACILKRNHYGADLVMPFVISGETDLETASDQKMSHRYPTRAKKARVDEDDAERSEPVREKFGMVIIQVKNCERDQDMIEVGYKLNDGYMFGENAEEFNEIKKVKIVMEIGLERMDKDPKCQPKPQWVEVDVAKGSEEGEWDVTTERNKKPRRVNLERTLHEGKDKFVRLKGLDSVSFLDKMVEVKNALKELLRGPICPTEWLTLYRTHGWKGKKGTLPSYRIFQDTMFIGDTNESPQLG